MLPRLQRETHDGWYGVPKMKERILGTGISLIVHGMVVILLFGVSQKAAPPISAVVIDLILDTAGQGAVHPSKKASGHRDRHPEGKASPPGDRAVDGKRKSPRTSGPPFLAAATVKRPPAPEKQASLPDTSPSVGGQTSPPRPAIQSPAGKTALKEQTPPQPPASPSPSEPADTPSRTRPPAPPPPHPAAGIATAGAPVAVALTGLDGQTTTASQPNDAVSQAAPSGDGTGNGENRTGDASGYLASHLATIRQRLAERLCYPGVARQRGWCGKVIVAFTVTPDGRADNIQVQQSSGISLLDKSALKTVQQACPFPCPPMASRIVVPIIYQLN